MNRIALVSLMAAAVAFGQQPKFEIADVHASQTSRWNSGGYGVIRDGVYISRDTTMLQLIATAYGVPGDDVAGGPGWITADPFDVIAKVPAGTTPAAANLMLRTLLADRFGLVIHNGTHPAPRYVLTVAKGGSKLKPPTGDNPMCRFAGTPETVMPTDPSQRPNTKFSCHNLPASTLAMYLRGWAGDYLDHDVIDSTKLEGSFDFDLEWTPRNIVNYKGADGVTVFNGVEKQLGLKLELQNVDVPSLVIESVNRKPTANAEGVQAKLAIAPPRFEVASVKLANPDRPMRGIRYTGGAQLGAGGTLRELMAMSLRIPNNVQADMIVGLPKSADSEKWEITGKFPATGEGSPTLIGGQSQPPPFTAALEMVHGVLLDQFELKSHTENRELTVYAITQSSSKPKLTPAAESDRSACKSDPSVINPATRITGGLTCKNTSLAELADYLQNTAYLYVDHPLVDATGIQGGWNFTLGWTGKNYVEAARSQNPNAQAGSANQTAADPSGTTLFEAIEKTFGLKVVKQKRSIPVIVVDHVDEKPLE
ncbi:MAG TPA: TIGR03435 family protein [Bryobacteraceae bacterium]|nr:TIGR03435 family protein [Bryobacteraceae bacterium]